MTELITELPDLINYWDYNKNSKLNIETLTVTSKNIINWKCPSCSYEWRASVSKAYKQFKNMSRICPVCDLGDVLVKERNSIYKRFPNFIKYINFHHENFETIREEILNLSFSSKRLFHFKCPTCFTSWIDVADSSRLMKKSKNTIVHTDCNKYNHFVPYTKAYPNLGRIYLAGGENKVEFEKLRLDENVTLPKKWRCDKCGHSFKMSLDRLISRIKRDGYYCTECKATFDTPIQAKNSPLGYTDSNLVDELVSKHIKKNMIDSLSNIVATWKCSKCSGKYDCSVVKRHQEGCPYCSNKQMLKGFNTLQETHSYLEKFWDEGNSTKLSDYWSKSTEAINWSCPCCGIHFQCSPIEMISRTNIENSNFETCPNNCDWDTLVFNNDILHDSPKLREEWSSKNGIPVHLALSHIETKKYWWHCSSCKQDYLCSIPIRREVKNTCPYCNDELPLKGFNTLFDDYPEFSDFWSKNNSQDPTQMTISGAKNNKFLWICSCCNLEFEEKLEVIIDKFSIIQGKELIRVCPYCTEKIPKPSESLGGQKSFLRSEWLENLNGDINKIFCNSSDTVEWVCRRCHRNFKARISERKENDNCCPYCSKRELAVGYNDLATTHPLVIKEWSALNDRESCSVMCNSNYRAWWKCPVCKGEYQQEVQSKVIIKKPCPYCTNHKVLKGLNDLATTHPWLINEWSTSNDMDFSSLMSNSGYKAWWKCSVCKGEYQQTVKKKILMKESCPYCQNNEVLKGFNDLETTHKHLMNEWDYLNNILLADPTEINEKCSQTVWWICKENSNHRYKLKINEKIKYEKRSFISCPICKGLRRKQEHFVRLKM
ncbi:MULTISPECIES: zinc-ribbon domain-containing protein [unclassified Streptococcus]|jgi:hypothetical protein|nr:MULTISPECIES: zinc-ribbon domain-containing protein [unclassified Streptococcus]OFN92090.1 hypothetical protein HMPREF2686_07500 [Streptococcus sp. HMSC057G03]OFQ88661.1 hypothetical protein HMPREF2917_03555 [Streptococcus sp. HMSC061E03]